MNKCMEYIELISVYADGELTGADIKRVEEHLSTCENCSAILDLYRETSAAVDDTLVPAPEALRDNVMKEILRGGAGETTMAVQSSYAGAETGAAEINTKGADAIETGATGDARRRKVLRIIMTRYVPIAACLALVLLTVPRFLNLSRSDSQNAYTGGSMSVSESAPQPSSAPDSAPASSAPGEARPEIAPGGSAGAGGMAGGGDAPAPSAAPAPAAPGTAVDDSDYNLNFSLTEAADDAGGYSDETIEDLAPIPEETHNDDAVYGQPEMGGELAEPSESEVTDGNRDENSGFDIPAITGIPEMPATIPEFDFNIGDLIAEHERGEAILFTSSIYAIIEVHGGLPALVAMYGLEPIEDKEMYFEIPRELADMLLEFVHDLDGIKITMVDEDGEVAVVMYKPAQ